MMGSDVVGVDVGVRRCERGSFKEDDLVRWDEFCEVSDYVRL